MSYLTLGKFTIQVSILASFLALFIGAFLFKVIEKKSLGDWYWNSIFIYIGVYKLSYLLFHFNLFWEAPWSVFYFNGGIKGHILAFCFVAIYIMFRTKKNRLIIKEEFIPSYIFFLLLYEMGLSIFEKQALPTLIQVILLVFVSILFIRKSEYSPAVSTQMFLLLLLIQLLLFSLFGGFMVMKNIVFLVFGVFFILLKLFHKEESFT